MSFKPARSCHPDFQFPVLQSQPVWRSWRVCCRAKLSHNSFPPGRSRSLSRSRRAPAPTSSCAWWDANFPKLPDSHSSWRTGPAGGTAGGIAVKLARPDGYTLLFGNAGTHAINPSTASNFPYDPIKDFEPVTGIMSFANLLFVPANSPARTVSELIALGRSRPEGLTFASQGIGSAGHVMAEMLRAKADVQMVHVPYKGGSPAVMDAIAGRVDFLFGSYLTAGAYIRDGKLRVLGYAAKTRSPALPEVPTMAEAGFDGVELDYWFAVFAPAGTPPDVVTTLNKSFRLAVTDPEVGKVISSQAAAVFATTPAELGALVSHDITQLGRIMQNQPNK